MKTLGILIVCVIVIIGIFWWSTKDDAMLPTEEPENMMAEALPMEGDKVAVNTQKSELEWTGRKILISGYVDVGTIGLKEGNFIVHDGDVVGGEFTFDMNTIAVDSTSNTRFGGDGLVKHLKSDDFFNVEMYPEARFVITKIESRPELAAENATDMVTGNLTIKDTTAPISFPAHIEETDGVIHATAMFDIDRTKWNVRYGSGSFFDDLGDSVIDDMVTLKLDVVGNGGMNN